MDTAAEKEPVFGMDEGERLNVGRKNEFFEGKMGQTEGNVGCPESESIASERDRLRTMEMAGQLECGEKCGKTATVEAGLGKVGLKSDIWRETAKIGQVERELGCRGTVPAGENEQKSDTRREIEEIGQAEREPGCRGSPSAELRNRGTVPAGENEQKSDTRREIEEIGQVEREPGSGGDAPAEASCRGTVSAGENDLKSDARRELGKIGQLEHKLGCRGSPPAELRDRGTVPAGENELKSDTRRKQGKPGQVERELGCRGSPPAELGCRGTAPAAVADAEEVLAALTRILRGEEEAKTSEVLRAAELLGKQYGLFGDREGAPTEAPKIVMDVPGRGEKK